MSNIYLKVITEKNWLSGNVDFQSFQNSSPGQLLWGYHADFKRSCCYLKIRGFSILILTGIMTL